MTITTIIIYGDILFDDEGEEIEEECGFDFNQFIASFSDTMENALDKNCGEIMLLSESTIPILSNFYMYTIKSVYYYWQKKIK